MYVPQSVLVTSVCGVHQDSERGSRGSVLDIL